MKFALFGLETLHPTTRGSLTWSGDPRCATITLAPSTGGESGEVVCRDLGEVGYGDGVIAALQLLLTSGLVGTDGSLWAIGHRLIHGGADIARAVRIDENMKQLIARYAPLAPLHIPPGLDAIAATESVFPDVCQIGVFDTAFFANTEPAVYHYAVPRAWYEKWGVRRYGFHGISHAYCAARAHELLDRSGVDLRVVICHLGQGASASAVRGHTALTSTMGMTPLEGLPMGTRSGAIDPGVLLHLMRESGMTVDQLDHALHHESGLLALSGISSDFRAIEQAAEAGDSRSRLAIDVFANRIIASVGSLTAVLGGLDVLVFTGGIGENAPQLRRQVVDQLRFFGIALDEQHNEKCERDVDVAAADSSVRVLVIHTREDLMIARQCRELIESSG